MRKVLVVSITALFIPHVVEIRELLINVGSG
jgi:hypothetical protein